MKKIFYSVSLILIFSHNSFAAQKKGTKRKAASTASEGKRQKLEENPFANQELISSNSKFKAVEGLYDSSSLLTIFVNKGKKNIIWKELQVLEYEDTLCYHGCSHFMFRFSPNSNYLVLSHNAHGPKNPMAHLYFYNGEQFIKIADIPGVIARFVNDNYVETENAFYDIKSEQIINKVQKYEPDYYD